MYTDPSLRRSFFAASRNTGIGRQVVQRLSRKSQKPACLNLDQPTKSTAVSLPSHYFSSSFFLSFFLAVFLSVFLCFFLSFCLSICLSPLLPLSISLSLPLSLSLSFSLPLISPSPSMSPHFASRFPHFPLVAPPLLRPSPLSPCAPVPPLHVSPSWCSLPLEAWTLGQCLSMLPYLAAVRPACGNCQVTDLNTHKPEGHGCWNVCSRWGPEC